MAHSHGRNVLHAIGMITVIVILGVTAWAGLSEFLTWVSESIQPLQ